MSEISSKSCSNGDTKCSVRFWMIGISSVNTVSDLKSSDTFEVVTLGSTNYIVQFYEQSHAKYNIKIVIVVPSTIIKLLLQRRLGLSKCVQS